MDDLPSSAVCHDNAVNLLDLAIVLVVLLAGFNGYRRGASLQLSTYAGLLLGLLVGALVAPHLAQLMGSPLAQAGLSLLVLVFFAALGDALGWLIGSRIWTLARGSALGRVDSVAGSVVAMVAGLLAIWFLAFNLVNGPLPGVSREIRGSAIIRRLDHTLPRPPSLLAEVRQFFNRFGFPEVFADIPPAPAGPVKGPSDKQIAKAVDVAELSTVKIVGEACGAIQEGSGFIGADHYVITNAHVVAGVRNPKVQRQNGGTMDAATVLFDPKLDIAILRVDGELGPPLSIDSKDRDRGTQGAVLGYPGGGGLRFGPAAVRRELDAIGRDIYGRSTVERQVYELQAEVLPGNSGGPFVETDGTVAGVVFAASTTDSEVGYAIASPQVVPKLQDAEGRTQTVSTGGCAR
jgi:S1-C subfamily serine protease